MMPSNALEVLTKTAATQDSKFLFATVTQASPVRIKLDGDSTSLAYTPKVLDSTARSLNDRVLVLVLNGEVIVLGKV